MNAAAEHTTGKVSQSWIVTGRDRMQTEPPQPVLRWASLSWWATLALFTLFILLPGPDRTPFSGAPLASRAQLVAIGILVLAAFSALFPPSRAVRVRWLVVLLVLTASRIALAPYLIEAGWKGRYWFVNAWRDDADTLLPMRFYQQGEIRHHRVDRSLDLNGAQFALFFVNDQPVGPRDVNPARRDERFPLQVEWIGYVSHPAARTLTVSANGHVTIDVDGRNVLKVQDPKEQRVHLPAATERMSIRVTYRKGWNTKPMLRLGGVPGNVTPEPASDDEIARAATAATWSSILGWLAVATLAIAFASAYRPVPALFLERIWNHPSRIATLAFIVLFAGLGLLRSIPGRASTVVLPAGDDFLTYAMNARQILMDGPLMTDRHGQGSPYFHYPLYPYALALAHVVFGEDPATVILFNHLCIAASGALFWLLLRHRASSRATILALVLLALMAFVHFHGYAKNAFSDNLYMPMVLATIAAFTAALERRSTPMFVVAGILTAFAAATRPSFLLFVPTAGLAIIAAGSLGPIRSRLRSAVSFVLGFFAGVSPFTIRNFLVSGKFVLLVASFVMLPFFLYPPERLPPDLLVDGAPPGLTASLRQVAEIVQERPLEVAWLEIRKLAFTLGITQLGPARSAAPRYFVITTLLFVWALWTRRIPWALQYAIVTFALSHLAAVVIAAPWTYGYKTILPMHVAFLVGIVFLLPIRQEKPRRAAGVAPVAGGRPKITVVLPTYNEKESIRACIREFFDTGVVDEVLVVNNNAAPGTSEEVAGTGAREIFEPVQGYGAACQRGLAEAGGDYIVLCEPDGTFVARDIFKLLAYADDFDVVYGSRTSQQFVWHGANMGFFLRFGNWAVAKYMEFAFNGPNLTDVGCTMRLVKREVAQELAPQYTIRGSQFGPEMMVLTLRGRYRMVQIPVNYRPRVGESAVTGDPGKALLLGLQMIWLITKYRLREMKAPHAGVAPTNDAHVPS